MKRIVFRPYGSTVTLVAALSLAACSRTPAVCPECQAYVEAVSTLEKTCLSGQSFEASAKIAGALDILKKAATGDAQVSEETIRGARKDWDANIGREENRDIRSCLESVQERLLTCIDRCVARSANTFPTELSLELLFGSESANPAILPDRIVLGMKSPPRLHPEKILERGSGGWFYDDVAPPAEDGQLDALIHRAVKDAHVDTAGNKTQYTELCLIRARNPPRANARASVQLHCREGEVCREFDPMDSGWLAVCDERAGSASLFPRQRTAWGSIIQTAEADTPQRIWVVPSLESLAERRKDFHDGYTVFSIDSDGLGSIDANGVSLHVQVNDIEVRVEGMPGEFLTKTFDPGRPLHLQFGLENLDLAGKDAGCDSVSAELRFWKGAARVGKSIVLKRSYAALRDGEVMVQDVDGSKVSWSAHYEQPLTAVDYRVFVQSILLDSWDSMKDLAKVRREVDKLEASRSSVNGLDLMYEGRPVVAVMRPPLTRPSWGLALGLLQETGQIRFTFTQQEAQLFLAFLRTQRSDQNAAKLIRDDSNLYTERRDVERPSICVQ